MANPRLERPLKQVNTDLHLILLQAVSDVPGDFIEFGVYHGHSFSVICAQARLQGRHAHAVDTFEGFPVSPFDADNERYPPGEANGPLGPFIERFPDAIIHQGLIPDILPDIDVKSLAFAHLDMDHEFSTYPALFWTWDRLSDGGIMIVHDYGQSLDVHASQAVKRWMAETGHDYIGICDNTIFFRKGVS